MSLPNEPERRKRLSRSESDRSRQPLSFPEVTGLSLMDAALAYANAGWYVLPTNPADIKNPGSVVKGKWHEKSSRDPDQIRQWWETNPDCGIALHCGRSNAGVFDYDQDDLQALRSIGRSELAEALLTATALQGTRRDGDRGHYIFLLPDDDREYGNSAGAFMAVGEFRGKNGVIIAAPTPHPDADTKGGQYRQIKTGPVGAMPEVLRECLTEAGESADPLTDTEMEAFLDAYTGGGCGREDCRHSVAGPVKQLRQRVANGESRHDSLVRIAPWAFAEAMAGCYSARELFGSLYTAYSEEFSDSDERGRTNRLGDEYLRIVQWAMAAAQAEPERAHRNDHGPTDDELAAFWSARSVLRDLHQFARSRRVGPWAMLGQVLARALTAVPPDVVLPPIIGGAGSLNLFIALVGESGDGKGASSRAAADWLTTQPPVYTATLGSGEGMGRVFAYKRKDKVTGGWEQVGLRCAVLFDAPEVDNLAALGSRSGSTLMPQLRSAYSGETLGFTYADPAKALQLCAHRYRLCLTVGVQPRRAAALFDDQDGGTPQRFVWLPVLDPEMPDVRPAEPPLLELKDWDDLRRPIHDSVLDVENDVSRTALLGVDVVPEDLTELAIPAVAVSAIEGHHVARHRGQPVSPLDGHKLQTQLGVAAALMWLDGRTDGVEERDWELAALVMAVSDRTREMVQASLRKKRDEDNRARGNADAVREVAKAEGMAQAEEAAIGRVAERIRKALRSENGRPRAAFRRDFGRDKKQFDEALDRLVAVGDVELRPIPGKSENARSLHLKEGR